MYCIDTSAIIDMKEIYPIDVFPALWGKLESLLKERVILSPREVLKELESKDDDLLRWAKTHIHFHNLDHEQEKIVKDIMGRFPNFVDYNKPTPEADPFVIALAKSYNLIVIAQEKRVKISGPESKPKIPNVCDELNVEWIQLLDLFRKQRWVFVSPT